MNNRDLLCSVLSDLFIEVITVQNKSVRFRRIIERGSLCDAYTKEASKNSKQKIARKSSSHFLLYFKKFIVFPGYA